MILRLASCRVTEVKTETLPTEELIKSQCCVAEYRAFFCSLQHNTTPRIKFSAQGSSGTQRGTYMMGVNCCCNSRNTAVVGIYRQQLVWCVCFLKAAASSRRRRVKAGVGLLVLASAALCGQQQRNGHRTKQTASRTTSIDGVLYPKFYRSTRKNIEYLVLSISWHKRSPVHDINTAPGKIQRTIQKIGIEQEHTSRG